jgi:hypothetical protein
LPLSLILRYIVRTRKWYDTYYMIREIRGKVLGNEVGGAIVEVAGFGIFVHLPGSELLTPGVEVHLKTSMASRPRKIAVSLNSF